MQDYFSSIVIRYHCCLFKYSISSILQWISLCKILQHSVPGTDTEQQAGPKDFMLWHLKILLVPWKMLYQFMLPWETFYDNHYFPVPLLIPDYLSFFSFIFSLEQNGSHCLLLSDCEWSQTIFQVYLPFSTFYILLYLIFRLLIF